VIENNSLGFVTTSKANLITINYYNPQTLTQVTGTNSNAAGNIVQITISGFSWAWMAPYGRNAAALQISASSSDVMEYPPNGIPPTR
jgi:hypothetical protein